MSRPDDLPLTEGRRLAAGPLSVELHGITLRYVRLGSVETVRRIYPAVRDDGWGTVPADVRELDVVEAESGFAVTFEASHRDGALAFEWRGRITGDADGRIRYEMAGTAKESFSYNRIGLCVAHPPAQAGRPVTYRLGSVATTTTLPVLVEPQRWEDGNVFPAFGPYDRLEISATDHIDIDILLTGDQFELEDQRNWADGSYKTYSTPLLLGWPHHAAPGDEVTQSVEVVTHLRDGTPPTSDDTTSVLHVGELIGPLPTLGLQFDPTMSAPTDEAIAQIDALTPSHLRVDLSPTSHAVHRVGGWPGLELARRLDVPLEVALHVGDTDATVRDAIELVSAVARQHSVARVLLLRGGIGVGDGALAEQFRQSGLSMPLFGATIGNFAEINRSTSPADGVDGVAFAMTPTFHDIDNLSIIEGLEAVPAVIRTAHERADGRPIAISPLTFRPKFNVLDPSWNQDRAIDERLDGPFVAGWLVGMLGHIGSQRLPSTTLFEAFGPRGVVGPDGTPRPVYSVLAQIAATPNLVVRAVESSDSLDIAAMAFDSPETQHILIANLRSTPRTVCISGLSAQRCSVSRLAELPRPGARIDEAPHQTTSPQTLRLAPFDVVHVTGDNND